LTAASAETLIEDRRFMFLQSFKIKCVNMAVIRFACLEAQNSATMQYSSKIVFITQLGHGQCSATTLFIIDIYL